MSELVWCDWCLREVNDVHAVAAPDAEIDDMVCRDCDPPKDEGAGR